MLKLAPKYGRDTILKMDRHYVFDVLFWQRDERGEPILPAPKGRPHDPDRVNREIAERRGLPADRVAAFVKERRHWQGHKKADVGKEVKRANQS